MISFDTEEPGDGRYDYNPFGVQMPKQVIEVPAECLVLKSDDDGIPAGSVSTTRCCGNVIASTTGPANISATCPTCGLKWTLTRERMRA